MTGSGKSVVVDYLTSMGIPKVHFGNMIYAEMAIKGENGKLNRCLARFFSTSRSGPRGQVSTVFEKPCRVQAASPPSLLSLPVPCVTLGLQLAPNALLPLKMPVFAIMPKSPAEVIIQGEGEFVRVKGQKIEVKKRGEVRIVG